MRIGTTKRKAVLGLCGVLLVMGAFGTVYGNAGYLAAFNTQYGTSLTALNSCNTCHTAPPALNPYGNDYRNSGFNFVSMEDVDSDGDCFANAVEISTGFLPGDPSNHPAATADTAPPTTVISNARPTSTRTDR
jgi:hypothetical protein